MKTELVRVAVIGLGRAGSGYDAIRGSEPRSHVGAIKATPGLVLVAGVDSCLHARAAAAQQWSWGKQVLLAPAIGDLPPGIADVITLCTPAAERPAIVEAALALRPSVLLIEKPLAANLQEAKIVAQAVRATGTVARVVFHRRFDAGHLAVKNQLPRELPRCVVMRYSKGLHNYGSHLIDLLTDWYGPVASVQAIGQPSADPDPALSFRCRMEAGFDAVVLGMSALDYDQFEADFYYRDRRIELRNGGCEKLVHWQASGLYYPSYIQLDAPTALLPPAQVNGLAALYASVRCHLKDGSELGGCSLEQALHGQAVLNSALASVAGGGEIAVASIASPRIPA